MAKCGHVSEGLKGKYSCPNNAYADTKLCMLHSPGEDRANAEVPRKQLEQDLATFLKQDIPELVFQDIIFPRSVNFTLSTKTVPAVIFKNCKMRGTTILQKPLRLDSLSFEDCEVRAELLISRVYIQNYLSFKGSQFFSPITLKSLEGNFKFEAELVNSGPITISETTFGDRISITIGNCSGFFALKKNVKLRGGALFNLETAQSKVIFDDVSFQSLTTVQVGSPCEIEIANCAIDCLYLKDVKWTTGEQEKQKQLVKFENPKKTEQLTDTLKKFRRFTKTLKKSGSSPEEIAKDISSLAYFSRNARDYFARQKNEYLELYDQYFVMDHYFSRLQPEYKGIKRAISWCYEKFSVYGYSLRRPFVCLAVVIFLFPLLYYWRDWCITQNKQEVVSYWNVFLKNLGQISFFRGPNTYFDDSLKRFLFIIEGLILIPLSTFIVIGIRKIFKR